MYEITLILYTVIEPFVCKCVFLHSQLLLHAPIAALPGHTRKRSSLILQDWKERKWNEVRSMRASSGDLLALPLESVRTIDSVCNDTVIFEEKETSTPPTNAQIVTEQPPLKPSGISVERFRAIMSHASGEWDLSPVVKELADDQNMISMERIASYRETLSPSKESFENDSE